VHPDVDGRGEAQHRCPLPCQLSWAWVSGGVKAPSPTHPAPTAARAQVVPARPLRSRGWELNSSLLWQAEERDELLRRGLSEPELWLSPRAWPQARPGGGERGHSRPALPCLPRDALKASSSQRLCCGSDEADSPSAVAGGHGAANHMVELGGRRSRAPCSPADPGNVSCQGPREPRAG